MIQHRFADYVHSVKESGEKLKQSTGISSDDLDAAKQAFEKTMATVETQIQKRPATALAIAAGVGVLIGWWAKRR